MRKNLSIKLRAASLLAFSLCLFACERQAEPAHFMSTTQMVDSLRTDQRLPGADADLTDSLVAELIPVLLSAPESRELEDWYALNSEWAVRFGDVESILFCAEIAYGDFMAAGEVSKAAQVKNGIGRIFNQHGDYPKALAAQQSAYELALAAGDTIMMGWALTYSGTPYTHLQDFAAAKISYDRALEISNRINQPGIKAVSISNLATLEGLRGNMDTTLILMDRALSICEEYGLTAIQGVVQLNISYIYIAMGQFDRAINFLLEQINTYGSPASIPNTILFLNLYEAYAGKEDFTNAGQYLDQGCAMAHELNYGYGILYCAEYRAALFEKQGAYPEALAAYKAYQAINEQQTGLQAAQEIQSLQTRMRLREKDLEIERLNKEQRLSQLSTKRWYDRAALIFLLSGIGALAFYVLMRNRHLAKSAEQTKVIAEAKLQALQSQMNPHFVFNALGGIQNFILKAEKIEAYNYLGKFAGLLRLQASHSSSIAIELEEEIDFIQTYLDLEKLRFREDFDYILNVAGHLLNNNYHIPSMMIQPVVENAIIHGLSGLERPGLLTVDFSGCEQGVLCVVTDNGRGRKAASQIARAQSGNSHLSIATFNSQQRIEYLHRIGYDNTKVEIEDLYIDGNAQGTRVNIYLPYMDKRKFN